MRVQFPPLARLRVRPSLAGILARLDRRVAEHGLQIVTEKKTTNLARGLGSTAFFLLETRLRGPDSRNRIREYLSRSKSPRNQAVSPEPLGASRLPSFARAALNTCHPEDRCFFRGYYRNPYLLRNPLSRFRAKRGFCRPGCAFVRGWRTQVR